MPITWPVPVRPRPSLARAMPKSVILILPVGGDQEVGRLDVAVHDAGPVRGADRVAGLGEQVADRIGVERLAAAQQRRQRLPVDELHHQERAGHAGAVGDARAAWDSPTSKTAAMPGCWSDAACRASVSNRERNVGVVGVLVLEQLDRDRAVERGVGAAPHLAHAAGGDPGLSRR